jgi:hypothetical protein
MKKILFLLFTLFLTSNIDSQSYIDVIRSSSYYSTAVINFTEGDYKSALYNLQLAEKNLKGNTNRDLEYLKIMSNYHLSNYKLAYDLTKAYFDVGFSERKKSFRNVTSYSETNNIHYEEVLTALFVSIEEKSKLKKNPDSDNSIDEIVTRISSNKVTFTSYANAALLSKVTEKIDYCLREFSNGSLKRVYENNFLNLKMSSTNKKYSFNYSGTISGRAINTSNYKINVTFTPTKPELNNDYYSYGYKQNVVKYLEGKITLKETAYQCYSLTAPKYKSSYFSNFLIKEFQQKNFTKKGYKTKVYQILFTEKEKTYLKQENNLTKLHVALKSKGLL